MKLSLPLLLLLSIAPSASATFKPIWKRDKRHVCKAYSGVECPAKGTGPPAHKFGGHIVIANRFGSSVSLVDPDTLTTFEYKLPDEGEPMYFAFSANKGEIWVADRANDRYVILQMKGCKLELDGFIPLPAGPFHSMITQQPPELTKYPIVVISCDIENVAVVHDATTRRLLATLLPPQETIDAGTRVHDATTDGNYIFVSFLNPDDGPGFVASYKASDDYALISVLETTRDPHVAIRGVTSLFIAAGGAASGNEVLKVSSPYLEVENRVQRPTPHGMFISFDGNYLYTTNILNGGNMAVEVFDTETGDMLPCPEITTSNPIPHNPVLSVDGKKLFITHSGGTSTINSVFSVRDDGCLVPNSEVTFETNLNPFGIAAIPPAADLLQCSIADDV